jgi:O-acetyl-ADP-ribose deacetylase (regulator of RNase III)
MINFVKGDATKAVSSSGSPVAIAHVCNNLGGWGKGFVLSLSAMNPAPERPYRASFSKGHPRPVLGDVQIITLSPKLVVANLISQDGYVSKSRRRALNYDALTTCLTDLNERLAASFEIHMPRIGAGLAGGDWDQVEKIIETTLASRQVVVYDLT